MPGINLRKATVEDIPTLLAIGESVNDPKTYPSFTKVSEWREELANSTTYIIEKDGVVVGDIGYEIKNKELVEFIGIAIKPEFQKQGIGRGVMAIILEELKNIKKIRVVTHPENSVAIKLYLSFGFTIKDRKENYFGDGEPRIELIKEQAGK